MVIIENMDNVPDTCDDCKFCYYDEYFVYGRCCTALDGLYVENYCDNEIKPSSCPLKEGK